MGPRPVGPRKSSHSTVRRGLGDTGCWRSAGTARVGKSFIDPKQTIWRAPCLTHLVVFERRLEAEPPFDWDRPLVLAARLDGERSGVLGGVELDERRGREICRRRRRNHLRPALGRRGTARTATRVELAVELRETPLDGLRRAAVAPPIDPPQ